MLLWKLTKDRQKTGEKSTLFFPEAYCGLTSFVWLFLVTPSRSLGAPQPWTRTHSQITS